MLTSDILILTKRINSLKDDLKLTEQRIEEKETQLDEKEDFCDSENKDYAKRRESRYLIYFFENICQFF